MEALQVEVFDHRPSARLVRLRGPLTLRTLPALQDEARRDQTRDIIVDIAGVPYMDSAGLGSLLAVLVSCHHNGRKLIVAGATSRVQTLFRITHLDRVLAQAADVSAAGEMLSSAAPV